MCIFFKKNVFYFENAPTLPNTHVSSLTRDFEKSRAFAILFTCTFSRGYRCRDLGPGRDTVAFSPPPAPTPKIDHCERRRLQPRRRSSTTPAFPALARRPRPPALARRPAVRPAVPCPPSHAKHTHLLMRKETNTRQQCHRPPLDRKGRTTADRVPAAT